MDTDEIDYEAVEREIRETLSSPGVPCMDCSASVPSRYIFGKIVYHPEGRPAHV